MHALGSDCLLFEIQQSCDTTYRVYDWGRLGLDGKPREIHVEESMKCTDFTRTDWGPEGGDWQDVDAGTIRELVDGPYFTVEEYRGSSIARAANQRCTVAIVLSGSGSFTCAGGTSRRRADDQLFVPAGAGDWSLAGEDLRVLIAQPKF